MKLNIKKRILCVSVALLLVLLAGCGKQGEKIEAEIETKTEEKTEEKTETEEETHPVENNETITLNLAYQYGLGYAPLVVAKNQNLIEAAYEKATGKKVEVVWHQIKSGADINTGLASGSLDVGFVGVSVAINGIQKGMGYKIFTNISGQEHGLMTNNKEIKGFDDLIGSDNQIALVNIGSMQHIILGMALENAGYDAHALDANIVAMSHPDGMTALYSGSISSHLTSNPYIFQEREEGNLYEIKDVVNAWGVNDTHLVGIAAESLHDNAPELYKALCDGIAQAINFINTNPEEVVKMTYELDGNSAEDELFFIQKSKYMTETSGILRVASFMARNGFIDKAPESYEELVFENVSGD